MSDPAIDDLLKIWTAAKPGITQQYILDHALGDACGRSNVEQVDALLKLGANPTGRLTLTIRPSGEVDEDNEKPFTALESAIRPGGDEVFRTMTALLNGGADATTALKSIVDLDPDLAEYLEIDEEEQPTREGYPALRAILDFMLANKIRIDTQMLIDSGRPQLLKLAGSAAMMQGFNATPAEAGDVIVPVHSGRHEPI